MVVDSVLFFILWEFGNYVFKIFSQQFFYFISIARNQTEIVKCRDYSTMTHAFA